MSHKVINVNQAHTEQSDMLDKVADAVTTFVGSWSCILLHVIWFTLWFVLHLSVDSLTLAVSLEAIFLCALMLMSQNRQADKDRLMAEHTYQNTVREEEETRRILEHLDEQDKLILEIVERLEQQAKQ